MKKLVYLVGLIGMLSTASIGRAGDPAPYQSSIDHDFLLRVAMGKVSGASFLRAFGLKTGISTTVLDDISEIPSTTTIPTPNGIQLAVKSSSINDTSSGTGSRSVDIHYLDRNYDARSETVFTNGTSLVFTNGTTIQRIQSFHTKTAGSGGASAGNISLKKTDNTTTYSYIKAGGNQSLTAMCTIPNGTVGYLLNWHTGMIKQPMNARIRATADRHTGELLTGIFLFQDVVTMNNGASPDVTFKSWQKLPARTDVKVSAISEGANSDCSASFEILLLQE